MMEKVIVDGLIYRVIPSGGRVCLGCAFMDNKDASICDEANAQIAEKVCHEIRYKLYDMADLVEEHKEKENEL